MSKVKHKNLSLVLSLRPKMVSKNGLKSKLMSRNELHIVSVLCFKPGGVEFDIDHHMDEAVSYSWHGVTQKQQ